MGHLLASASGFEDTDNRTAVMHIDLTREMYAENMNIDALTYRVRKVNQLANERKLLVFASIRSDLMRNELLYISQKAVQIASPEMSTDAEEHAFDSSLAFPVSTLTKSGASRLEIDDRHEFSQRNGFSLRKKHSPRLESRDTPGVPTTTFKLDFEATGRISDAGVPMIIVEDSDADSEDDLDADLDF